MKHRTLYLILIFLCLLFIAQSVVADNLVEIKYFYSATCGSCKHYTENVIEPLEKDVNYSGKIIIIRKEVGSNRTNYREMRDFNLSFPSAVVNNETRIPKSELNSSNLIAIIDAYLAAMEVNDTYDESVIEIPFFGKINTSELSLPLLTILLGGLDSFNPCAFFILVFLLNLLIYAQSRRKMLLVGGIFIFFSFLFYILFMFIIFGSLFIINTHFQILSIIAGIIALVLGILNIKDYFSPKKGPSLSIPDSKRPKIFKQMRNLVKNPYLPTVIIGTIILASTVNFFELACSLGFPLIYTTRLIQADLAATEYYFYILMYNIVYIIPLIIILLIFIVTLGRMDLSEIQVRALKLGSGFVFVGFGIMFLIGHLLLSEILWIILLIVISIILTIIISKSEKYFKKES